MSSGHVDNARLRRAIVAFADDANQRTMLDVLRAALVGDLLLDVTGADLPEDESLAGADVPLTGGIGPDGKPAMLAFTSGDQVARMHPAGAPHRAVAQPAGAVLEIAQRHGVAWLSIDPGDDSVAIAKKDIAYALRHPRNDRLSRAIAAGERGGSREAIVEALQVDGPLLLAGELAEGQEREEHPRLRMTTRPDGRMSLLAFTSAPEIAARHPEDGVISTTTSTVLERLHRSTRFSSLVINPAGPWVEIRRDELT
jgi:hypothetical protein